MPPNIVIVAIDSLRADHLGCYGYGKPTSPMIDMLASQSIVFDRAFAAGIPTMPSFTTLYTGQHPYRHGIVAHIPPTRRLPEGMPMLPQLAKQGGYITFACDNLAVQGDGRGSWFARGYDHYSGFLYRPFGDQSKKLTDRALQFMESYAQRPQPAPVMMFIHYWDPHSPYAPLPPYDTLHYQPGSGAVDMADVRRIHPEYYDGFLSTFKLRHPDDYAYIVAQYDGEISQVDVQVGRLVSALKQMDWWDNTIFVLLSDHGECFGEGDFYFDHHGLYDAVTRIALMIRVPGCTPGRVDALVSNEDLTPTLGKLVGLPEPAMGYTGQSFASSLAATTSKHTATRPFVVSVESTRQASLALRTTDWKLILPVVADAEGRPVPDFYGRPRSPAPLLFDLQTDPEERHNLSEQYPVKLAEMLALLDDWRQSMNEANGGHDMLQTHGLTLSYETFMERMVTR